MIHAKTRIRSLPWNNIFQVVIPLVYFGVMFYYFPFRDRFEFDTDEGINAMKALLFAKGYPLYTEIWSDQPPIFTFILSAWFRVFGFDINVGRVLVLIISSTMIYALYQNLRITWGSIHAISGVMLLILLPYYNTLSVSIMIGLPSIALATLALSALVYWHKQRNYLWLSLSAATLALSILIKLFTGILVPIFIIGIFVDGIIKSGKEWNYRGIFYPVIIWCGVFTVLFIGIGLIFLSPNNIYQLIEPHFTAGETKLYSSITETYQIAWYIKDSWPIIILALIGVISILIKNNWISLYFLAWSVVAYLTLLTLNPVWYHHQLLVTIPITMLAGIALGQAIDYFSKMISQRVIIYSKFVIFILVLVGLTAYLIIRLPETYYNFRLPAHLIEPAAPEPGHEQPFLTELSKYAEKTNWVITDLPIYAFRVNLPVPPELAVFSEKRLVTGNLNEQQIIEIVDAYKPEQVLIGRFNLPILEEFLKDDYRKNHFWGKKHLYILGEIKRLE